MKHNLKIGVSKEPQSTGIAACKNVCMRERLLRFLFGNPQKLTIIIPGDSVEEVAIKEIEEGGNQNGKGETNCGAD